MMFCSNCGTQLPDEANFCWKCGKPQKQGAQVEELKQAEETKYETCEIFYKRTYEGYAGDKGQFTAEAIGPEGKYCVARSEEFSVASSQGPNFNHPAHKALVNKLVTQGWEQSDRGTNWYNTRFRRKIDPNWDRCVIDLETIREGFFKKENKFCARAGGAKGVYNAGDSPVFNGFHIKEAKEAHRVLVERLIAGGWEPTDVEIYDWDWWAQRFRRRVR
jgi:ribosomal protein S27AE